MTSGDHGLHKRPKETEFSKNSPRTTHNLRSDKLSYSTYLYPSLTVINALTMIPKPAIILFNMQSVSPVPARRERHHAPPFCRAVRQAESR